jgi:sulfatase maturation enzyme AslB (radical SAM superfamily)
MIVSIAPSFKCNFDCNWCYLSNDQLKDPFKIDLLVLNTKLLKINEYKKINHIDLYGGEISILPLKYLIKLNDILLRYTNSINVISNLFIVNPYFKFENVELSVSYDYVYRQHSQTVYNNIQSLNKKVSILTLAIPKILNIDIIEYINHLNENTNIKSLEIKKYSSNQNNQLSNIEYQKRYEDFIFKFIEYEKHMNFKFVNKDLINNSLNKQYVSFSNDHIYITPQGEYATLDFDKNSNEYFRILKDIDEYIEWAEREIQRSKTNLYCNTCKYNGVCLTEHIRLPNEDPKINSCDGAFLLLEKFNNVLK